MTTSPPQGRGGAGRAMSGMNGLLLLSILVSLAHLARARDAGGDRSHAFLEPRGSLYFDGASPDPRQTTYYESPAIEAVGLRGATVSAWVRVERHKRYNWVAGTANRDNGWALFVDEGEKACFGLFQNKQLKTISTRSLQIPKAWHYVTGVFDNGTIQVFVDAQPGEVVPLSHRSLSHAVRVDQIECSLFAPCSFFLCCASALRCARSLLRAAAIMPRGKNPAGCAAKVFSAPYLVLAPTAAPFVCAVLPGLSLVPSRVSQVSGGGGADATSGSGKLRSWAVVCQGTVVCRGGVA